MGKSLCALLKKDDFFKTLLFPSKTQENANEYFRKLKILSQLSREKIISLAKIIIRISEIRSEEKSLL